MEIIEQIQRPTNNDRIRCKNLVLAQLPRIQRLMAIPSKRAIAVLNIPWAQMVVSLPEVFVWISCRKCSRPSATGRDSLILCHMVRWPTSNSNDDTPRRFWMEGQTLLWHFRWIFVIRIVGIVLPLIASSQFDQCSAVWCCWTTVAKRGSDFINVAQSVNKFRFSYRSLSAFIVHDHGMVLTMIGDA